MASSTGAAIRFIVADEDKRRVDEREEHRPASPSTLRSDAHEPHDPEMVPGRACQHRWSVMIPAYSPGRVMTPVPSLAIVFSRRPGVGPPG